MSTVEQTIGGTLFIVAGAVLVFGTRRRWGWLVDPPEDLWFVYSGSSIKKFCGTDVLELLNIYLGVAHHRRRRGARHDYLARRGCRAMKDSDLAEMLPKDDFTVSATLIALAIV
jgi:hypothetical protein